jgi:hypothetical protein
MYTPSAVSIPGICALYKKYLFIHLCYNIDDCVAENASEQLMYVLFWGSATAISLAVMMLYGTTFVDQPRLTSDKVKVE